MHAQTFFRGVVMNKFSLTSLLVKFTYKYDQQVFLLFTETIEVFLVHSSSFLWRPYARTNFPCPKADMTSFGTRLLGKEKLLGLRGESFVYVRGQNKYTFPLVYDHSILNFLIFDTFLKRQTNLKSMFSALSVKLC